MTLELYDYSLGKATIKLKGNLLSDKFRNG